MFGQSSTVDINDNNNIFFSTSQMGSFANGIDYVNQTIDYFKNNLGSTQAELSEFYQALEEDGAGALAQYIQSTDKANVSTENFYKQINVNYTGFEGVTRGIRDYNGLIGQSADMQNKFTYAVGQSNNSFGAYLQSLNGAKASFGGYVGYLTKATVKSYALAAASAVLNAAITAGVSFLVTAGISAISDWINKTEIANEELRESSGELKEYIGTIEEYKSEIISLRKQLDDGNLSFDEQKNIREKLISIQDDMIAKYGSEIKQVDLLTDSVNTLSGAMDQLTQKEAQKWLAENKAKGLDEVIKNVEKNGIDFLDDVETAMAAVAKANISTKEEFDKYWEENIAPIGGTEKHYKKIINQREQAVAMQMKIGGSTREEAEELIGYQSYISEYLTDVYDALTNGNVAVTAWNWLSEERLGLMDEDIETYKEAGQYLSLIYDPDIYNKATEALSKYNDALASGDVIAQKTAKDNLRNVYNEFVDTLDRVPEEYQGVVGYYLNGLMEDIVTSTDEGLDYASDRFEQLQQAIDNAREKGLYNPEELKRLEMIKVDLVPDLSESDFNTLLDLVQGKINTNVNWLTFSKKQVNSFLSKISEVANFDFAQFYEDQGLEDIEKQISTLQSAYKEAVEGTVPDSSFFKEFPDLAKYADDTNELAWQIRQTTHQLLTPAIKELTIMINNTDDTRLKENLINVRKVLNNMADTSAKIKEETKKTTDEYAKQKEQIKKNINALSEQVKKIEKAKKAEEERKENLEKQREIVEKSYDARIKAYDEEIEKLQEEGDEQERINDLKEKEIALENAKNNKTRRYSASRSWVIESDSTAVSEAQQEYDKAVRDNQIADMENQKEELEKEKEQVLNNYDEQIAASERQIEAYDNELNKYKELIDQQKSYLDFYKTYSDEFATKTDEQATALEKLNKALEKYTSFTDLPNIFAAYEAARSQFDENYIPGYANGGAVAYNGFARVHGGKHAEMVLNNSDVAKLYNMIHGSTTSQLTDVAANNLARTAMRSADNVNTTNNNATNYYSWNLSGNEFRVNNYDEFKGYMDRYVREAQQDLAVGR